MNRSPITPPLLAGLYFALVYLNYKLRRSTAKPFQITTGNYKQFRQQFDDLTKLVKWADKYTLDWSKIRWYEKPFAKQFQKMFATIKDRQQKMQTFLTDMDRTDIVLPDGWEHKTGQELWEGRPSPYEYLV